MTKSYPENNSILIGLADFYCANKEYNKAINNYSKILNKNNIEEEERWRLFFKRGICYERLNNWKLAEGDLMQSLDINISKWVQWNDIILKLGVGGIFYNGKYFKLLDNLPNTFEGEINYFGINLLKSISVFDLGLELKINPERLTMSLFFQKEFF